MFSTISLTPQNVCTTENVYFDTYFLKVFFLLFMSNLSCCQSIADTSLLSQS